MKLVQKHKTLSALLAAVLLLGSLAACGGTPAANAADTAPDAAQAAEAQPETTPEPETEPVPAAGGKAMTDPSGAAVTVPEEIDTIVTLAPSLAQTVVDLGFGDKIVGYDLNSVGLEGLDPEAQTFDTVAPDVEALVALHPDVLLVSSLSLYDQEAPYQPLIDSGVCVLCVPTSESIADVMSDITFLAEALGVPENGKAITEGVQAELDAIAGLAAGIPEEERKSVYFEISAAPYMYSTGAGTYLHELIELIGANNILADTEGWCSVEAETVVAADPDVILTNVNYIEDPVGEIKGRDGWAGIKAVANGDVYPIDNMASSLPNEYITTAAWQMLASVYPDVFSAAPAA